MTEHKGKTYYTVTFPHPDAQLFRPLVDESGVYDGLILNAYGPRVYEAGSMSARYEPRTFKLERTKAEQVVKNAGFTNFEIVYSGVSKDEINLLYREYTPDDMARPAFTQNLVYPRTSSTIRFRDVSVRLVDADGEAIRYVVEADGLPSG